MLATPQEWLWLHPAQVYHLLSLVKGVRWPTGHITCIVCAINLHFFLLILFLPGQQFQMHVLAHLGSQDPVSYV